MPGRKWYLVAAAIFALGVLVFAGFLFLRLRGLTEGFTQVVVPGVTEIEVADPGLYTIYRETGTAIGNVLYGDADLTGLRVVVRAPGGGEVELLPAGVDETYTMGGRSGVAIFRFEAPQAGTYRLEAAYERDRRGPAGVLAVGRGFTSRLLVTVLAAFGILGITLLTAGLVAGVTLYKRNRGRREPARDADDAGGHR